MIQNQLISLVRTWVPIGVGAVVAWLAVHFGIHVDAKTQAGLVVVVTALIQGGYYLLVRGLEARWPQFGVLLGVPAKPHYPSITASPKGQGGYADAVLLAVVLVTFLIVLVLLFHGRIH